MKIANTLRIGSGIVLARWSNKEGDQSPISCIEIEMRFSWDIQVRLVDHERHTKYPLVEVNGRLAIGTDKGDVMNALYLYFRHSNSSILVGQLPSSTALVFVSFRLQGS